MCTDLAATLRAADAVQFGEFELAHGGTSEYYVDKYRFETDPDCLSAIGRAFADQIDPAEVDAVAGVALGAVPLVAVTSVESGLPSVIVRKSAKAYGTGNRIEGSIDNGDRVVVLEDVATTGTSAREAAEALEAAGADVDRVLVVVDREDGARETLAEAGFTMERLLSAGDLLEDRPS